MSIKSRVEHHTFELGGAVFEFGFLRDDLLHPHISGNKFRKLQLVRDFTNGQNPKGWASVGGAYSNHLHALAHAGNEWGIPTLGVVPGMHYKFLSPTLKDCQDLGMHLELVERSQFEELRFAHPQKARESLSELEGWFWMGEGGFRPDFPKAYSGLELDLSRYQRVCIGVGSGSSAAGLMDNEAPGVAFELFPCVAEYHDIIQRFPPLNPQTSKNVHWHVDHVGKGYGKLEDVHFAFAREFHRQTGVLLDPIYTLKMTYQIIEYWKTGLWNAKENVLLIHTGGTQGWKGFPQFKIEV